MLSPLRFSTVVASRRLSTFVASRRLSTVVASRRLSTVVAWRATIIPPPLASAAERINIYGGTHASPQAKATFAAWHESVDAVLKKGENPDDAMEILKPHMLKDCVFRPPTYYKPWTGRDETLLLLGCVSEVFGPSFEYGRQWLSDDGHEWALEFKAQVGDSKKTTVHGIDLVSLCPETSKIAEFTVLARPPNAVEALKKEMMMKVPVRLAALKAKQALGFA